MKVCEALLLGLGLVAGFGGLVYGLPNAVQYEIDARLDVAQNVLRGVERLTLTNHSGQALDELYFHLVPNAFQRGADTAYQRDLRRVGAGLDRVFATPQDDAFLAVELVTLAGRALDFSVEDTLLRVALPAPLEPDDSLTLELDFVNDLIEANAQNRFAGALAVRSGVRDGVYTVAKWYPQLVVFDATGWHLDRYHLLGEFYGDFGDYTLRLTLPAGMVVGASGELTEKKAHADGTQTLTFRAERVHDVAWVASSRFRVEEKSWQGKTLRVLWLDQPGLGGMALDGFRFYSQAFGAYAYDTLTVAQVEVGGGMEYPGLVMIADGSAEEVSHEVAHQWWYAAVGNNEFDETWLDEGPATFSSELYRIEARGEPPSLRRMLSFSEPGVPVLSPSTAFPSIQAFVQAVYDKGSGIFWMLDELLGRERLLDALRAYYKKFKFQNATSQDLEETFSRASGQDLGWFFDQWLRTTAVLDVALGPVRTTEQDGQTQTTFAVFQQGQARMPVRVRVVDQAGAVEEFRWDGQAQQVSFSLDTAVRLRRIELDPEQKLLEVDRSDDTWQAGAGPLGMVVGSALVLGALGLLTRRRAGA